jgi:hypothetical protein
MSEAHPLTHHPLYGVPCPLQPDFWTVDPANETPAQKAGKKTFFVTVLDWLFVNYAYREGGDKGKGGAISLVNGKLISLTDLRRRMAPWALRDIGPRKAIKRRCPVVEWLDAQFRYLIHDEDKRPDRPWPIFTEDGHTIYNHYRPPAPPASGDEGEGESESEAAGKRCAGPQRRFLPGPMAPLELAVQFFAETYTLNDGNKSLYYWRGSWWRWEKTRWCEVEETEMRAQIYRYTRDAVFFGFGVEDWNPNDRRVSDVLDALTSVCLLATTIEQPCWLDGRVTGALVPCANGIYDLNAEALLPHSPLLFNIAAVPFDYDPAEWNKFTAALWPESPESIARLEEWIGYVISGRTDLHKIFFIVGPRRGGRGTIGRILGKLLGPGSTCGPTLKSMGGEFGLMPFIGRALAVVGDARSVGENIGVTVERLLSISGEDTLDVNRKNKSFWTGRLPTRIMIFSNELLKLVDASPVEQALRRRGPFLSHEPELLLAFVTGEWVDHLAGARCGRGLFLDRSGWGPFLGFSSVPGGRDLRLWGRGAFPLVVRLRRLALRMPRERIKTHARHSLPRVLTQSPRIPAPA